MKKKFLISVLAIVAAVVVVMSVSITASEVAPAEEKFRGPTLVMTPVVDVIEKDQDAILYAYIDNPSINDVVLCVEEAQVSFPSGIHFYPEDEALTVADGVAYMPPFEIAPENAKMFCIRVKADENAKIGPHCLCFSVVYYPKNNKNLSKTFSLTYPEMITVKEPSKEIPPVSRLTSLSPESASVYLHGERTSVTIGEDIRLSLSAINLITKPTMTLQLILKVPSGMSITSTEFTESGAGQYTATYTIEPGKERYIGMNIKTNQAGDFNIEGDICYYFGGDKSTAEYKKEVLPVKVNPISTPTPTGTTPTTSTTETPGFEGFEVVFATAGLLAVAYLVGRKK